MRKQEVNLMKVRVRGTKAKIRPNLDLTLSSKQRENCKVVLCKLQWFYNEHDQTATTTNTARTTTTTTTTTTITTTTNNNVNNIGHPMRCHPIAVGRRSYSFNTLSTSAHIGVPAALHPEKSGTHFTGV
jgi:hypothetical protein